MTVRRPNVIEIKLDRLIDDMRLLIPLPHQSDLTM